MNEFFQPVVDFSTWFFSQQWDSVTGPWLEANKYTLGTVVAFPVLVAKWRARTKAKIAVAKAEADELIRDELAKAEGEPPDSE